MQQYIRKQEKYIIEKNKAKYNWLGRFFGEIYEIPYAVIKGEPLSLFAYKDVGYRDSADIDILTSKEYANEIGDILRKEGFEQNVEENGEIRDLTREEKIMFANSHEIPPFINRNASPSIEIDINIDMFWGEYKGKRIDILEVLKRRFDMCIYGVKVKSLSAIDAFIQVCLHHYREMNALYTLRKKNSINTKMFQDIYCFYINNFAAEPDALVERCKKYQVCEYVYYLLYYSNQIFNDKTLDNQLVYFKTEESDKLLDCYGLNINERKRWPVSFSERLDCENIYGLIEMYLSDKEKKKIEKVLSIFS